VTEANTKLEGLLTQRADGSLHLLGNPHYRCSCLGMRFQLTLVFFRPSRACYFPSVGPCHRKLFLHVLKRCALLQNIGWDAN